MPLKERLVEDVKAAMKAREELRLSTLRMARSEIRNAEIALGHELEDSEVLGVLEKEAKKRREAIAEFETGGRQDLVEKETEELRILESYLPAQMSEEELREAVQHAVTETGASRPEEIGKVMRVLMPKIKGRADGKAANALVREMLGG